MAGRNRNSRSRDMLISMGVLIIPVLLIVMFFSQEGDSRPEAVNVSPILDRAATESPYPLLHAEGLTDEWRPVRADWARTGEPWVTSEPALGNSWQLGYLSPDDVYFSVLQRDAAPEQFVSEHTREGKAVGGEVDLADRQWQRFESEDGRTRSLVHVDGDLAEVVSADTDFAQLEAFASTLIGTAPPA